MRKIFLYAALLTLTQCSKCKDDDPAPETRLPLATQTGANTFGCLVNGEPWTPKGRVGLGDNLYFEYDPTFNGGVFVVSAYRAGNGRQQIIGFNAKPVAAIGSYSFALPDTAAVASYVDTSLPDPCDEVDTEYSDVYRRGTLTITRLDNAAGIVSGTFDITMARAGCDTIRLTHGRFDLKR